MTKINVCITLLMLSGSMVFAGNAQTDLAHQIEEISRTSKEFKLIGEGSFDPHNSATHRHFMIVNDCMISAETVVSTTGEVDVSWGIDFDLSLAQLPDPDRDSEQGFMYFAEQSVALIPLEFVSPYKFQFHGDVPPGTWPLHTAGTYHFIMEALESEAQPLRFLELLKQYQSAYCSPSG